MQRDEVSLFIGPGEEVAGLGFECGSPGSTWYINYL